MSKKGFRQRSFAEPGCIGCDAHLDFGLSRYCAGFKNKKRRKHRCTRGTNEIK